MKDSLPRWPRQFWMIPVLLCPLAGCANQGDTPALGAVSGTVTLDGKPLVNGVILFEPEKGRGSNGLTDSNGHYALQYTRTKKGAKIGKQAVKFFRKELMQNDDLPVDTKNAAAEKPKPLPKKYNTDSTMTVDVEPGSNTFDFKLNSTGK